MISLSTLLDKIYWRLRIFTFVPQWVMRRVSTPFYDLVLSKRIRVSAGAIAWKPRMAIFLIFPSRGLLRSHLSALSYLHSKDFAPVIVSNIPLSDDDRTAVLAQCHRLIERPNFGYDFGGYRDGILSVAKDFDRLESVALLNDSCWFPIPGSSDWLDDAQALNVDFAGAASNYGTTPQAPGHYEFTRWNYSPDNKDFHYCSFALLISKSLLRDRGFQRFWTGFSLTNNKREVVRRGELGLSRWVIEHGFSHASTLDIANFDADLERLPTHRIREIAKELVIPEERPLREEKARLLGRYDGADGWRDEAIRFILIAVVQVGPSYAFPEYAVRERRYPFLKKSPVRLERESAESTLRILRSLEGEEAEAMLEEALLLRR